MGRGEKVRGQTAVTELGFLPTSQEATVRHVFGHAAKRAQGGSGRRLTLPPVLNKRALGEKSLPVGAVSVLTLSLTVF